MTKTTHGQNRLATHDHTDLVTVTTMLPQTTRIMQNDPCHQDPWPHNQNHWNPSPCWSCHKKLPQKNHHHCCEDWRRGRERKNQISEREGGSRRDRECEEWLKRETKKSFNIITSCYSNVLQVRIVVVLHKFLQLQVRVKHVFCTLMLKFSIFLHIQGLVLML